LYSALSKKQKQNMLDKVKAQLAQEAEAEMLAEIDFEDWNDAFDHLNSRFWKGTLEKIPVVSAALKNKKAYGLYHHEGKISLGCDYGLSAHELLGVLLHEMCHHYVNTKHGHGSTKNGKKVIGHGKHWKTEMRRVGYLGKITKHTGYQRFLHGREIF